MSSNTTKELFKKFLDERRKLTQNYPKEVLKQAQNYDNQQIRKNVARKEKYNNDEDYREQHKQKAKETHAKNKLKKPIQQEEEPDEQYEEPEIEEQEEEQSIRPTFNIRHLV